jgi:hypothetical protein
MKAAMAASRGDAAGAPDRDGVAPERLEEVERLGRRAMATSVNATISV